jgi:hypothetical protein
MVLSALLMIFTGIVEALPRDGDLAGHHIAAASLFVIAAFFHVWYNRKPVINYFSGLGWRWAIIAVCFFAVLAVVRLFEKY